MNKGLSIGVFILGLLMTGLSLTVMILGACGMGARDRNEYLRV